MTHLVPMKKSKQIIEVLLKWEMNQFQMVTLLPGSDVPGILNLEKVFLNFDSR